MGKQRAEGAVFAASVLPRIHAASPSAAATIDRNMSIMATTTSFSAVKSAFESVYADLGITCRKVGGIVKADGTDVDEAAADDGGTDDDKAAADDGGTDDDKAAAADGGTDDGCNGIGSTTMSTIVVLLSIFIMSA